MASTTPRPLKAEHEFTNARMTGFGGWFALALTAERLGLFGDLAEGVSVKVRRRGASGGGALSDLDELRADPAACRLLGGGAGLGAARRVRRRAVGVRASASGRGPSRARLAGADGVGRGCAATRGDARLDSGGQRLLPSDSTGSTRPRFNWSEPKRSANPARTPVETRLNDPRRDPLRSSVR